MNRAAGRRDQLVTIQEKSSTKDALGQATETWTAIANGTDLWAEYLPLRGRELFAAGAEHSEMTAKFRIDYLSTINSRMRVLWNGVPYAIVGDPINVAGGNHTMELNTASGVKDSRT